MNLKKSGTGEPMLVLHGWGMNSNVWEPVREPLEKNFTVSWLDLPGHGMNAGISAASLDETVDLVAALLTQASHIMGWSLGGMVAQALLQKLAKQDRGKTIKSITLVASSPRFSQSNDWVHAMGHEVLDQFSKNLQKDIKGTIKRFIALQFMGVRPNQYFDKKTQRDLSASILNHLPREEALKTGLEILKHADLRSSDSQVPQHWILGGKDRLIPVHVANDLKLLRPDDQITLFETAGHAPFMTHPQEFIAAVTRFIYNKQ